MPRQHNRQLTQPRCTNHRLAVFKLVKRELQARVDDEHRAIGNVDLANVSGAFFDFNSANVAKVAVGQHHGVVHIGKVKHQLLKAAQASGVHAELAQLASAGDIGNLNKNAVLSTTQATTQHQARYARCANGGHIVGGSAAKHHVKRHTGRCIDVVKLVSVEQASHAGCCSGTLAHKGGQAAAVHIHGNGTQGIATKLHA